MTDLISRQTAIDAILHNQEVYSNNFGDDPIDKYTIAIIDNDAQTIAQLPPTQPEIIRCKDCTRYEKKWGCNLVEGLNVATAECFCSYAERREK